MDFRSGGKRDAAELQWFTPPCSASGSAKAYPHLLRITPWIAFGAIHTYQYPPNCTTTATSQDVAAHL
jgi:hypothetical protein